MPRGIGAVFFAVLHAGSAAGRLALGWAAYRVGPHRLWLLIVVVGGIGSVALLALAAVTDATGVLLLLVVLGLTIGSYPGVVQAMALITVPRQSAAAAIGINMTLVLTGAMLAPLVIGAVVDLGGGFRGAFVALAAAPALGCLLLAWTRDRGAHRSG